MRKEVISHIEQITRGEKLLNIYRNSSNGNDNSVAIIRDEYEPLAISLNDLQSRQLILVDRIEKKTDELTLIDESLAEKSEILKMKTDGDSDGTAGPIKFKNSIRQIQIFWIDIV